ncbi:MAG: YraN family protein [Lewinellaceae bacterium]|nr:YraN family protein [Lewinellaceae bacterium]
MAEHHETGKRGEDLATDWLRKNEYEILEKNWRYSRAEVDIIARKNGTLIFLEVKTRRTEKFGHPAAFVTPRKRRFLADAAQEYMRQTGHDWAFRFDIISVLLVPGYLPKIEHFPDAFFPGLR